MRDNERRPLRRRDAPRSFSDLTSIILPSVRRVATSVGRPRRYQRRAERQLELVDRDLDPPRTRDLQTSSVAVDLITLLCRFIV